MTLTLSAKLKHRPWVWPLVWRLAVVTTVLSAAGLWAMARSDLFLGDAVDRRLSAIAEQLGGEISYADIGPAGLTGIALSDVVFRPNDDQHPTVRVAELRLFPDLLALLGRRFEVGSLEIEGLEARLDVDLAASMSGASSDRDTSGDAQLDVCGRRAQIPEDITLLDGRVHLVDASGVVALPALSLSNMRLSPTCDGGELAVAADGRMTLPDGSGGRLSAQSGGADGLAVDLVLDDRVDLRPYLPISMPISEAAGLTASRIRWRGSTLTIAGLAATQLNAPIPHLERWRLDGVRAAQLEIDLAHAGPSLRLHEAELEVAGILLGGRLSLRRGALSSDWSLHDLEADLVLGSERGGSLSMSLLPGSDSTALDLAFEARDYAVDEWVSFLSESSPVRILAGVLNGQATVAVPVGDQPIAVSIDAMLTEGHLRAPALARYDMESVAVGMRADLSVDLPHCRLTWQQSTLALGEVPFPADGEIGWADGFPRISFHADARSVSAAALHTALPSGLAPAVEGALVDGSLSGHLYLDLDSRDPDAAVLELELDASNVQVAAFGPQARVDQLDGVFAVFITTPDGVGRTIGPLTDHWIDMADVPEYLIEALVSAEDGRFWSHEGFDWDAILGSVVENLRARRFARGGSTISQQVARSMFLSQERTLGRKLEEAFVTWQLEQRLHKRRIMELYINAVHWGPGIYGIAEAAEAYFGKTPEELTLRESAFLAAILSNPNVFGRQYARGVVSSGRRQKICNILLNMSNSGNISGREYRESCDEAQRGHISEAPSPTRLAGPEVVGESGVSARLEE